MTAVVLCWCIDCIYNKAKDGVCACNLSTVAITPNGCTRYTKCNDKERPTRKVENLANNTLENKKESAILENTKG